MSDEEFTQQFDATLRRNRRSKPECGAHIVIPAIDPERREHRVLEHPEGVAVFERVIVRQQRIVVSSRVAAAEVLGSDPHGQSVSQAIPNAQIGPRRGDDRRLEVLRDVRPIFTAVTLLLRARSVDLLRQIDGELANLAARDSRRRCRFGRRRA